MVSMYHVPVVADTTKVRIFKQITTRGNFTKWNYCCCWYHKGTNFQANHNPLVPAHQVSSVVADTTKVRIFKQITTTKVQLISCTSCCWYHKGTNFQANHNTLARCICRSIVVADTTKVRIFKQITTSSPRTFTRVTLLLIPQRYEFSSKSQLKTKMIAIMLRCCWYHKGTNFQANHNRAAPRCQKVRVVADTTKVRIFKQITTVLPDSNSQRELLLIPQRYEFSSKSQRSLKISNSLKRCCWYHKGTNFQANHNTFR